MYSSRLAFSFFSLLWRVYECVCVETVLTTDLRETWILLCKCARARDGRETFSFPRPTSDCVGQSISLFLSLSPYKKWCETKGSKQLLGTPDALLLCTEQFPRILKMRLSRREQYQLTMPNSLAANGPTFFLFVLWPALFPAGGGGTSELIYNC